MMALTFSHTLIETKSIAGLLQYSAVAINY